MREGTTHLRGRFLFRNRRGRTTKGQSSTPDRRDRPNPMSPWNEKIVLGYEVYGWGKERSRGRAASSLLAPVNVPDLERSSPSPQSWFERSGSNDVKFDGAAGLESKTVTPLTQSRRFRRRKRPPRCVDPHALHRIEVHRCR